MQMTQLIKKGFFLIHAVEFFHSHILSDKFEYSNIAKLKKTHLYKVFNLLFRDIFTLVYHMFSEHMNKIKMIKHKKF